MIVTIKMPETGPIRPPSEAQSILLRVNRNCPHNQCLFCPVYKEKKFSLRSTQDVKADIDVYAILSQAPDNHISQILNAYSSTLFLQDADPLCLDANLLLVILEHLRERLPQIKRVTSYVRVQTVLGKTEDGWKLLREAGLSRVHLGLESGYDPLLSYMHKGQTAREAISASQRIKNAGIELFFCTMPGLSGNLVLPDDDTWKRHAEETARVINETNPDYIGLHTLAPLGGYGSGKNPLFRQTTFRRRSKEEVIQETIYFLKHLRPDLTGYLSLGFETNPVKCEGQLPGDLDKIILTLENYLIKYTKPPQSS